MILGKDINFFIKTVEKVNTPILIQKKNLL